MKKKSSSSASKVNFEEESLIIQEDADGIISIPPNAWVLKILSEDLKSPLKKKNLETKMTIFKQTHPTGVLLFEGYARLGIKNKIYLQNLVIDQFNVETHTFQGFVPTRNEEDTKLCLRSIARREQFGGVDPLLARVKRKTPLLADAQQFFIEGLLQCGPKKALELLKIFGTPQKIVDTIINTPKEISVLKGFGEIFLEQNKKMLYDHFSE